MEPWWAGPRLRHELFARLNKPRKYKKTASFFRDGMEQGPALPKCCNCGFDKWKVEGLVWKTRSMAEDGFPGRVIIKHRVRSIRCAACGNSMGVE